MGRCILERLQALFILMSIVTSTGMRKCSSAGALYIFEEDLSQSRGQGSWRKVGEGEGNKDALCTAAEEQTEDPRPPAPLKCWYSSVFVT